MSINNLHSEGEVLKAPSTNSTWGTIKNRSLIFTMAIAGVVGLADKASGQTTVAMNTRGRTPVVNTSRTGSSNTNTNTGYRVSRETAQEVRKYREDNHEYETILAKHMYGSAVFLDEFLPAHIEQARADSKDNVILGVTSKTVGHYHVWLQQKVADRSLSRAARATYQAELDKLPLAMNSAQDGTINGDTLKGLHITINHENVDYRFDVAWMQNGSKVLNGVITNIEHGDEIEATSDDYALMQTAARRDAMLESRVRNSRMSQSIASNR